jgi:Tfp pilus assembly protein PilO
MAARAPVRSVQARLRTVVTVIGPCLYLGLLAVLLAERPALRRYAQAVAERHGVRRRPETQTRVQEVSVGGAREYTALGSEPVDRRRDRSNLGFAESGRSARSEPAHARGSRARTAVIEEPRARPRAPHRARAAEWRFQRSLRPLRSFDSAIPVAAIAVAPTPLPFAPEAPIQPHARPAATVEPRPSRIGSRLTVLPPWSHQVLLVVALLVTAILGYFVLISPKRSAAAEMEQQIQAANEQIQERKAGSTVAAPSLEITEMFQLTRAMPRESRIPDVILELTLLARASGVSIESIGAQPAVERDGYRTIPIAVTARGTFFGLSSFLAAIRKLVQMDHGRIRAAGRLLTIDSVSYARSGERFPGIRATLAMSALTYQPAQARREERPDGA